ncbi:hypothetical protein [Nonomuraea sp. NPDC049725]|uniref:hypothetical protein n=1 Tax=Nonomuraea sp. NPDC049725 TaxID=3154508 RepID=UPI0034470307
MARVGLVWQVVARTGLVWRDRARADLPTWATPAGRAGARAGLARRDGAWVGVRAGVLGSGLGCGWCRRPGPRWGATGWTVRAEKVGGFEEAYGRRGGAEVHRCGS